SQALRKLTASARARKAYADCRDMPTAWQASVMQPVSASASTNRTCRSAVQPLKRRRGWQGSNSGGSNSGGSNFDRLDLRESGESADARCGLVGDSLMDEFGTLMEHVGK